MRAVGFDPSLILILLIFDSSGSVNSEERDLQYSSRARRACCAYSSYSQASIKSGTIPCGSCCHRTPPPPYPTPLIIPPLPFTIRPTLPPSPTALYGCSVCG